jgi:ectoine hydroxylase-related dioxygenase (phytanoyl-CoA dioxygenase family)
VPHPHGQGALSPLPAFRTGCALGYPASVLTPEQRADWEKNGFIRVEGFAMPSTCQRLLDRARAMAQEADAGQSLGDAYVVPESKLVESAKNPEDRVSKLFRVHRCEPVFSELARDPLLLDLVEGILGPDLDCFLSQFIFKLPGALGQPWHQDAFYFPFDRGPQVGAWLAITSATRDNGPLWVLPGSHREPVHAVVPDRRAHANAAYVEIVDHDMTGAFPVLMEAGDLLLFHSHLMHCSSDNESHQKRAAMVTHYGEAGTVDQSRERWGLVPPNVDWMPVRRHAPAQAKQA